MGELEGDRAAAIGTSKEARDRARSRRARDVRPQTENIRRVSRRRLHLLGIDAPPVDGVERPRTRGDCAGVERPCPFVGCRHSLYLETSPRNGSIKWRFPDLEPGDMPPERSCSLDVADQGGATLQETADALNMVRERVRQIQRSGFRKVARAMPELAGALEGLGEAGATDDDEPEHRAREAPVAEPAARVTPIPVRPLFATPGERRTRAPRDRELHDPDADEPRATDHEEDAHDDEEENAPMAHEDRTERILTALRGGPLALRSLALAAEVGPYALRDAVRELRAEGRIVMLGKGAAILWGLAGGPVGADVEAVARPAAVPASNGAALVNGTAHHANGASRPPSPPSDAVATDALVAEFEWAREALIERRRVLAEDLARVNATLGEASPDVPDAEPPAGASGAPKRSGRPLAPSSHRRRVLAFVAEHPGATMADVARGLDGDSGELAGVLFDVRRSGRVTSSGVRPTTARTALGST